MKTCACLLLMSLLFSAASWGYEQQLQVQVLAGNWRDAERSLRDAEAACRRGNPNRDNKCIDKVQFSRAWMYSRRGAEAVGSDQDTYYRRAQQLYLEVLRDNPAHLPTLDNLVLVLEQLNDSAGLERLLPTLARLGENKRAAKIAYTIGDVYREGGNSDSAFAFYNRAYQLELGGRALDAMIAAFKASPDRRKAESLWQITEDGINLATRKAICEAIISQRSSVEQEQWETAAIHWLAWLGRDRRLSASVIQQSINRDLNPEFEQLLSRLNDPRLGLPGDEIRINDLTLTGYRQDGWWHQSLLRTWAFTIAAWSEGHNQLLNGNVEAANSMWLAALQFAPPTESYSSRELENRWAVSLELLTDLARIQQLQKQTLDPNGERFARIEDLLFASKAQAYAINEPEAIQRHHTIMGKMYADLGIFSEDGSPRFRNAEFQLSAAIETAQRRGRENGIDDPQPVLAKLLADGYSCRLPNQRRCAEDRAKAERYYYEAARDFIKLDAVVPARNSIEALKVYRPQGGDEVKQLENIIELRSTLTRDQLEKGLDHPDVIIKQVDLATKWEAIGEDSKARDSLNRAVLQSQSKEVKADDLYQSLKRGDAEEVEKISREKLLIKSNAQQ